MNREIATTIKEWKSYSEQLSILEQRGLVVTDHRKALKYLERLGYYRLSGYWFPFRLNAPNSYTKIDQFAPNTTFENIVQLYIFDKKLRLLVLDAIERIEMALRVDIAYCLGQKGALAYLLPQNFHGKFSKHKITKGKYSGFTQQQVWLQKFNASVKRNSKTDFVQHHQLKYGAQLPVWAAIELWDFGMMSTLYAGMKVVDQNLIASKYQVENGLIFAQWLRSLNHIRNIAAHHSRLWNVNIVDRSDVSSEFIGLNNAKPFLYLCIMKKLLNVICPNSLWGSRLVQLFLDFPILESRLVNIQQTGCRIGWHKEKLWQ
ncbi:Abi family protein [Acinetobacter towneri]|jgi:abortive infection bacteriophage resistance protein|uniref:Abi family protein n=1 Tax=Acinetobacter towneri TaxID=202956 RepID=UPI00188A5EB6|nr:Abi family protein [Acinetobacter towneri]MBF4520422.1 Abi family protein [Acinetobacter towneri]